MIAPKPKTRVIQVDLDAAELGRSSPHSVGLLGDTRKVLEQLLVMTKRGLRSSQCRAV